MTNISIHQKNKIIESIIDKIDVGYDVFFIDQNLNWNSFVTLNENPSMKELVSDFCKNFKLSISKIGIIPVDYGGKEKIYALTYNGMEKNAPTNCILFVGCSRMKAKSIAYDLQYRTDVSAKIGKLFSDISDFFGASGLNRSLYWKK